MPVPKGAKFFRLYQTSAFMGGRLYYARSLYLDEIVETVAFHLSTFIDPHREDNCKKNPIAFIIVYKGKEFLVRNFDQLRKAQKELERMKGEENKCI